MDYKNELKKARDGKEWREIQEGEKKWKKTHLRRGKSVLVGAKS